MSNYSESSPDRKKKLHRLLSILRMLDDREKCTPASLAEKFDTKERTIFRDMRDLDSAGFSIRFDKETGTYTFTDPDFTLRDFNLNSDELMALLLGKQIASKLSTPLESAFDSLLKKVRNDSDRKTKEMIKGFGEKQKFVLRIDSVEDFDKIETQYKSVMQAMKNKEEIEITYKAMGSQKETTRRISPYGLFNSNGIWYVLAFCNIRSEIRQFALDCIKSVKPSGRHYVIPESFNMEDYFKPSWQIVRYGKPVDVVLWFSKDVARWIKRRKWHPSQQIEENKDGSLIFKVKLEGTEEIKWWTYNWIPHCEILAPAELRKEVVRDIKAIAKMYNKIKDKH